MTDQKQRKRKPPQPEPPTRRDAISMVEMMFALIVIGLVLLAVTVEIVILMLWAFFPSALGG